MVLFKGKKDKYSTRIIIILAVAGILYFGYKAISDNMLKDEPNPFEYNIENFKRTDASLIHYKQIQQIELSLQKPHALAIGPDDNIYVSGDSKYLILDLNGSTSSTVNCGEPIQALCVDGNRDVYVATDDHVQIYDKNGIRKQKWDTLGDKALITSIAVNHNSAYIADAGQHIVWHYNKDGTLLKRIGEKNEKKEIPGFIIPSPFFDIAIDPDGYLWVVNPGRHSIENYTAEGDLRTAWGEYSMDIEGFCGCCNPTHISIQEDGSFVTSEKGLARIKIYNRLGKLVSVVAGPDQFMEGTVGMDLSVDSKGQIYVLDPKTVRVFQKKSTDVMESSI
jgi:ligand-binding sensor domain-containing protein